MKEIGIVSIANDYLFKFKPNHSEGNKSKRYSEHTLQFFLTYSERNESEYKWKESHLEILTGIETNSFNHERELWQLDNK